MNAGSKSIWMISILLIIVVIGFVIFGSKTFSNISDNTQAIDTLKNQVNSLQTSLSKANSLVNTMQSQLGSLSAQQTSDIAALQAKLSSIGSQVTALQNQANSASTQASSDISALQAQINTLQNRLTEAGSAITALKDKTSSFDNQISALQEQITTINLQLETPSHLFSSLNVTESYYQEIMVISFQAVTAGHLFITGYSTSNTGYVYITGLNNEASAKFSLGINNTTVIIPVQAGTYSIFFGNLERTGTVTAVLNSIIYYHY